MKSVRVLFIFGALPLLGYPFVLIGALFWFVSLGNLGRPSAHQIAILALAGATQLLALAYPIVFGMCFFSARAAQRDGRENKAFRLSITPLLTIGVILVLALFWAAIGR